MNNSPVGTEPNQGLVQAQGLLTIPSLQHPPPIPILFVQVRLPRDEKALKLLFFLLLLSAGISDMPTLN